MDLEKEMYLKKLTIRASTGEVYDGFFVKKDENSIIVYIKKNEDSVNYKLAIVPLKNLSGIIFKDEKTEDEIEEMIVDKAWESVSNLTKTS